MDRNTSDIRLLTVGAGIQFVALDLWKRKQVKYERELGTLWYLAPATELAAELRDSSSDW